MNNEAVDIYCALLVKCGFGKLWPSLTQPRQQPPRRGSAESTASWHSRFDVVGKAMHYFENGSRKGSAERRASAA